MNLKINNKKSPQSDRWRSKNDIWLKLQSVVWCCLSFRLNLSDS